MTVPPELVWLIERLRSTPSRRERVRLLLQGREVVRAMSTQDRLAVARELGFDGADRLVQDLADRRGFSAELWLKMLEEVEQDGGADAAGVVRGLLDPATRGASVSRLIDAASGWVADLDAYRSEPVPDGEFVANAVEQRDPQEGGAEFVPHLDGDGVVEVLDGGRDESPRPSAPPVETVDLEPPVEAGASPLPPPPPIHAEPARSSSVGPTIAEADVDFGEDEVPREPPAEAATGTVEAVAVDRVMAELGGRTNSSARLAALRGAIGALAGADVKALGKILAAFPEGWARRRALETLYRGGLPESLESALELMAMLTRDSERMWALTTFAASRALSADETDLLLAVAGSPALARRLSHRIQRIT